MSLVEQNHISQLFKLQTRRGQHLIHLPIHPPTLAAWVVVVGVRGASSLSSSVLTDVLTIS
ncbi:hypothetical protein E2C01_059320 [Portunus trituberculatus]|uniref:Uncharacterized protein n=1 Tax=Portunus trituberculatus TaxID=210409 RepID=A0A5B7H5R1_PORTR|nr:hypothetical protein [Portunus trituberculatus]